MCAMSPRLLRPIASGVHPEAADWRARVIANGGTVSGSTLQAVSRFCASISAAGIRHKFYRLNLLCGTGLSACLVPLYRNTSFAASPLGNSTDTNSGALFVSGDYAETVGLTAGSTKYLNTGLSPDNMQLSDVQAMALAYSHGPVPSGDVDPRPMGAHSATDRFSFLQSIRSSATGVVNATLGRTNGLNSATIPSGAQPSASWVASRTSATLFVIYKNGAADATLTTSVAGIASHANAFFVARNNNAGTPQGDGAAVPYRHYSIGSGLTSLEVTAYENALSAFRVALGRTA